MVFQKPVFKAHITSGTNFLSPYSLAAIIFR